MRFLKILTRLYTGETGKGKVILLQGESLIDFFNQKGTEIARVYKAIFEGHPFYEEWPEEKAFNWCHECLSRQGALAAFLIDDGMVKGFIFGTIIAPKELSAKDLPFCATKEEQKDALMILREEFLNEETVLVIREMGALRGYRGVAAPNMIQNFFIQSLNLGAQRVIYWTKVSSPAYSLGVGYGWRPLSLQFSFDESYRVMSGEIIKASHLVEAVLGGGVAAIIAALKVTIHQIPWRIKRYWKV